MSSKPVDHPDAGVLVFQYGSNTSSVRLNSDPRLQGEARSLGLAQTVNVFELRFTVHSSGNGCAAADLTPGIGRHVYGVLYEIPARRVFRTLGRGETTLDDIEEEGIKYVRARIQVRPVTGREDSEAVQAYTYLVRDPRSGLKTCAGYVRHILSGLREHRAPEEYIEYVKTCIRSSNPEIEAEIDAL